MVVVRDGGGGDWRGWDEVGSVHLSSQRNRLKMRGLWCRVILVRLGDEPGWCFALN